MIKKRWLAGAAALTMAACSGEQTSPTAAPQEIDNTQADSTLEKPAGLSVADAIAAPSRPTADRKDDASRRPADILAFTGVTAGMTVLEMEAGNGYYTELFSSIVGPSGKVFMQNPAAFDSFLGDAVTDRLGEERLPNVQYSKTNFDALEPGDASIDLVTWFLGPHEIYFTPSDGASLGEEGATYAEIFRVLKPGGAFIVLDHAARPGSPKETGGTLHRIDPAIVEALAVNAGFKRVEESDLLRNPGDMFDMGVFDPAVRRKTDRFVIKYVKPKDI
ncbi:MAG: class I SAM-dependent methyltransferase [Pseudomonadota bacterium]